MNIDVKVKVLSPLARLPEYQTPGASGMDLRAALGNQWLIYPMQTFRVPTGLAFEIPAGYEGQVRPRSGLALRDGVVAQFGTIDADYRGEVGVIVYNSGECPFYVKPGMRIAQIVFAPVARATLEVVGELPATERGNGGFGSTGT